MPKRAMAADVVIDEVTRVAALLGAGVGPPRLESQRPSALRQREGWLDRARQGRRDRVTQHSSRPRHSGVGMAG